MHTITALYHGANTHTLSGKDQKDKKPIRLMLVPGPNVIDESVWTALLDDPSGALPRLINDGLVEVMEDADAEDEEGDDDE